jgi:diguanylate cyclase (GGDEF)-like protein
MTPEDIGALISTIGLLTQAGGAVLMLVLFSVLLRANQRRPYFAYWTRGWAALVTALTGVGILYLPPVLPTGDTAIIVRAAGVIYQVGKLLFIAYLVGGTLNYLLGLDPHRFRRVALPCALGFALVTSLIPELDLNHVMLMQAPVVVAAFGACSLLFLRLPRSRATLGSRAIGVVFGSIAGLWIVYGVALAAVKINGMTAVARPLNFVLQYNSYFDLLAQMLLGFGMVVVLLEDARREADDARAQLAVAHDHLRRVSLYDPLTGALNRRAYDEGVGLEAVGARFGTALVLDMDNLKAVNDTYGHAAGDDLLRRTVEMLRRSVRPLDRVYRLGGDEFLVLFPAARVEDVMPRIRAAIREANEGLDAGERDRLTIQASMGAADFGGLEDLPAAVHRADHAMYEEKARNRAVAPARVPVG